MILHKKHFLTKQIKFNGFSEILNCFKLGGVGIQTDSSHFDGLIIFNFTSLLPMVLNINQLRSFFIAAKLNSISMAAKALMVTPPAITMQIKQLEKTLGFDLMFREKNAIRLTQIGEQVFQKANAVFHEINELENFLEDMSIGDTGELKIGCHDVPAKYIMPKLIGMFNRIYPDIKIILELGKTPDMIKKIHAREIPLALVVKKQSDAKLIVRPLVKDEVILVSAINSDIIKADKVSIRNLQSLPLIVQERESGIVDLVNQHMRRYNVTPNVVMETGSQDVLKEFIIKDMALAFVEQFAIQKELEAGQLRKITIKEGSPYIELGICYLREKQQSPIIQAFLKLLDEKLFDFSETD